MWTTTVGASKRRRLGNRNEGRAPEGLATVIFQLTSEQGERLVA